MILLTYLVFYWEGSRQIYPCVSTVHELVFLDFGKFVDLGEQTRSNFRVTN